jgi:hypothetical protein
MFKNSDSDNNTEDGITHSGRPFKEVHLANLFKKKYGDEVFYSGEEVDLTYEEYSEFAITEEVQNGELLQGERETLRTTPIVEVITITPPVILEALSNQSNQSSQSNKTNVTKSLAHTQLRNLGRSMANEMRLPILRGDGSNDSDQHWFLWEIVWSIKQVTNEVCFRDHALNWTWTS